MNNPYHAIRYVPMTGTFVVIDRLYLGYFPTLEAAIAARDNPRYKPKPRSKRMNGREE